MAGSGGEPGLSSSDSDDGDQAAEGEGGPPQPEAEDAGKVRVTTHERRSSKASSGAVAVAGGLVTMHVAARQRVFGDPRTLYGRAGGVFGLSKFTSRMMDVWMANPVLNANAMVARWHTSQQRAGFKFLVTQLMGYLTGGPQRYTGRPIDVAHKHLAITLEQWEHFMADADQVLHEYSMEPCTRRDLHCLLANFRVQCVVVPGETVPPDPGLSAPNPTTAGTLFYTLGGVYPVAQFVDRLVELVLRGDRVHIESHRLDDPSSTRHSPGLKYMVTELVCKGTGGVEVVTSENFDEAKLGVPAGEWPAFLELAREAAGTIWRNGHLVKALLEALECMKPEICIGIQGAAAFQPYSWSAPDAAKHGQDAGVAGDTPRPRCPFAAALGGGSGDGEGAGAPPPAHDAPEPSPPQQQQQQQQQQQPVAGHLSGGGSGGGPTEPSSPPTPGGGLPESPPVPAAGQPGGGGGKKVSIKERGEQEGRLTVPKLTLPLISSRRLGSPLQEELDQLLFEDPEYCCPISLMLLVDPVIASDGFVYEKESLQTLLMSSCVSPMSRQPLERHCEEATEERANVGEFRKKRALLLLDFFDKAVAVDEAIAVTALERTGEYVHVLKAESEPELTSRATKMWESLGRPVPPELMTAGQRRKQARTQTFSGSAIFSVRRVSSASPRSLTPSSSRRVSSTPRRRSNAEFQQRLDLLLAAPDRAEHAARKLYKLLEGRLERLQAVRDVLMDKWGFPPQLFPLLWQHIRRTVFKHRGDHLHFCDEWSAADPSCRVEEGEWTEAFTTWLYALHARSSQAKVTRKMLVQNREREGVASDLNAIYFPGPKLGEGAYGEVHLMLHKQLGVERVVKTIRKDQLNLATETVESEVDVLKTLDHPYIVRIYETFATEKTLRIVMDYAEGGDLGGLISTMSKREKLLTESWVCTAVGQIAAALEYTHSKGVIHCDLKPANAMLLKPINPDVLEAPHVLLVDFGLAEMCEERKNGTAVKVKGTPLYLSPEAFSGQMSVKSDMWALGIMVFEMLRGRRPFQAGCSVFVLWSQVSKTEPPYDELPPLAAEVVRKLLTKDPMARPTAKEIRELEWFSSIPSGEVQGEAVFSAFEPGSGNTLGRDNYFHRAVMFCMATELSMKDKSDLLEVFRRIDKTKSGRLTLEQLAAGLETLGIKEDPEKMMAILDMDQNGYISYTEFLAGMLSIEENFSERLVRAAFETFDLDGNGSISTKELRMMLSGDGHSLVDVLPDGQTIDEIMEEIADGEEGGEGTISFNSFWNYLTKHSKQALGGDDHDAPAAPFSRMTSHASGSESLVNAGAPDDATAATAAEESSSLERSKQSQQVAFENMCKELDGGGNGEDPASHDDVAARTRLPSIEVRTSSGNTSMVNAAESMETQLAGDGLVGGLRRQSTSSSVTSLPPLHRWLLKLLEQPGMDEAVGRLLDFPDQPLDPQFAAQYWNGFCGHFVAGCCLAGVLAQGRPQSEEELRKEVLRATEIHIKAAFSEKIESGK